MTKEFILTLIKTIKSLREEVNTLNLIIEEKQAEIYNLKIELLNEQRDLNE